MAHSLSTKRYSTVGIALHWLIALLIFGLFPVGLWMTSQEMSPDLAKVYALHKSTGITVLALGLFRIVWRLFNPAPPLPAGMPPLQKIAAHATHGLLYVGMIAVPLCGWLGSSAAGRSVSPFGLFTLPDLVGKDKALVKQMFELHELFAYVLMALVLLHILATVYHQLIQKDNLIARMSFFGPSSRIG